MSNVIRLLTNATTSASGSWVPVDEGGLYILEAEGTWNSATMTFESKGAQKGNAISVMDDFGSTVSFTVDSQRRVYIGTGELIRATIASAGGSTNLSASLKKVRLIK